PDLENAEIFVQRLVRKGLVFLDRTVAGALHGEAASDSSVRTTQRRFVQATGVTQAMVRQIERARHATNLLRQGVSILDAAMEAGYYDQAHLTRSLRRFIGQTPMQVASGEAQLSFLYKTEG